MMKSASTKDIKPAATPRKPAATPASKPASPEQARRGWDLLLDPERWNDRERQAFSELHAELKGEAITQSAVEQVFARSHRLLHAIYTLRICSWVRDTPSLRQQKKGVRNV